MSFQVADFLMALYDEPAGTPPPVAAVGEVVSLRRVRESASSSAGVEFEELPEPPPPCANCGSLELARDGEGVWRCLHCEPPFKAIGALKTAERIRRRLGIPSPAGAAEMLRDLKRFTGIH